MAMVRLFSRIRGWTVLLLAGVIASVNTASSQVIISQVYGGGGASTGSPSYKNDFVELFNRGTTTIDLTGYSVQYASASGSSWSVTTLAGSIAPGQYYLIQGSGGLAGATLPTPEVVGTFAMSAINGKVALVGGTTALEGACPIGPMIIDLVGYGSANCFEGSGAVPVLSTTLAALRSSDGCADTDNNAGDFFTGTPSPRNSTSLAVPCGPVPITLNYFNGSVNTSGVSVDLIWGTESETNNYGFEIQKKLFQSPVFETIPNSFVPGHGTTLVPQHYTYSDNSISSGSWYYRLVQIDLDGTHLYSSAIQLAVLTSVREIPPPTAFSLQQNYPNPFNPTTSIKYQIPNTSHVVLMVYDVLGQEVATLVNEVRGPGAYTARWDASGASSGVYFCRMRARPAEGRQTPIELGQADFFVSTKRLLLLK